MTRFSLARTLAILIATFVAFTAAPAHSQTLAQLFKRACPTNVWPSDPNHPIRRLSALVQNNSDLSWRAIDFPPPPMPPDGATSHAVEVLIQKRFHHVTRVNGCIVYETNIDISIVFDDDSTYYYGIMTSESDCPPSVNERAFKQSILQTATLQGSSTDAEIASYFQQILNGQFSSFGINQKVQIPAGGGGGGGGGPNVSASISNLPPEVKVQLNAAVGATVDLRGNSGAVPICATYTPAVIRAGSILTDPGVTLGQLFTPEPQVLPAQNAVEIMVDFFGYPQQQAPTPDFAVFRVMNLGNVASNVNLVWSDTAGWTPPASAIISMSPGEITRFLVPVIYPPVGAPTDRTTLTLTATALTSAVGGFAPVSASHDIVWDTDTDGDGLKDAIDPCPIMPNFPTTPNLDADVLPDICDPCFSGSGMYNFSGIGTCPCGIGDFNGNGQLAIQDIFDFLAAWFQGDPRANVNGGSLAVSDIFDFLSAWFAGCP